MHVWIAACMTPTSVRSLFKTACITFQCSLAKLRQEADEATDEQEASASTCGILALLLVWATERRRKMQQQHAKRVLVEWLEMLVPQADIQALCMDVWRQRARCAHLELLDRVEDVPGLVDGMLLVAHPQEYCCRVLGRQLLVAASALVNRIWASGTDFMSWFTRQLETNWF